MSASPKNPQSENLMINEIEREAIEFAQSILEGKQTGAASKLTQIERQAVNYAKNLLRKFKA